MRGLLMAPQALKAPASCPLRKYLPRARKSTSGMIVLIRAAAIQRLYKAT